MHDVGYRPLLLGIAESLDICRFSADNIFVGGVQAVEVLVEDEADKLDAFLDLVRKRKPEDALIEDIEVSDYEGTIMKTESYYRYLTTMQLSKMASYGARMIGKQDETVTEVKNLKEEFRDYREEFKDYRDEFRDYREEFRDFARRTDMNFRLISEKYGEISDKLTVILNTLIQESKETREMLNETMKTLKEALEKLEKRR